MVGDWNARHLDWDDKTNKPGRVVRNWVLQWNLTLRAPVTAPTYLTPFGRSVVGFFVSRGAQIDHFTCGNGTWDSISDHSLVSDDIQFSADSPIQTKSISKAMLRRADLLQQGKKIIRRKGYRFP